MDIQFDHEKLRVYQEAIGFVTWWGLLAESLPARSAVRDQLDRASTSIPLNIAEGNAKRTARDRCHYFNIARGSAFECAAALDVAVGRRFIDAATAQVGKTMLHAIVSMLVGLTQRALESERTDRMREDVAVYDASGVFENDHDQDHEHEGRRAEPE